MADNNNIFLQNMQEMLSPEGIQKYFLGNKKNGEPRAVYDIVKDYTKPKKKKKKHKNKNKKHSDNTSFSLYLTNKKGKKKKKKNKNKKYWHI